MLKFAAHAAGDIEHNEPIALPLTLLIFGLVVGWNGLFILFTLSFAAAGAFWTLGILSKNKGNQFVSFTPAIFAGVDSFANHDNFCTCCSDCVCLFCSFACRP